MSYPDVVIRKGKRNIWCLWKHSEQLRQLVKHDNNMKDYSRWVGSITITANHSNYLVCMANTQSVTGQKVVKL